MLKELGPFVKFSDGINSIRSLGKLDIYADVGYKRVLAEALDQELKSVIGIVDAGESEDDHLESNGFVPGNIVF